VSQLIIADLNFFESELFNSSEVKGGAKKARKSNLSTAVDTGVATDVKTKLQLSGTSAGYSVGSAVATGVASAVSLDSPAQAKVVVKAEAD
jgi:hypothetical protein